jgi:primase-polymerase (primpol)-like protein
MNITLSPLDVSPPPPVITREELSAIYKAQRETIRKAIADGPFKALAELPQFILWKLEPRDDRKMEKIPVNTSGWPVNAHDPANRMTAESALGYGDLFGLGVGFVFTAADQFAFVDLDHCIVDGVPSPFAKEIIAEFPDAAIEVSQSGTGLHLFFKYTGEASPHNKKYISVDKTIRIELYKEGRFVALTGTDAQGDSGKDYTGGLHRVIGKYLKPTCVEANHVGGDTLERWYTYSRDPDWKGPEDDDELIERMLKSRSSGPATFGSKASRRDLFEANEEKLAIAYPPLNNNDPYDRNRADMALACHLAFWTGKDPERIERIMLKSALKREKWDSRPVNYFRYTILKACDNQTEVLGKKKKREAASPSAKSSAGGDDLKSATTNNTLTQSNVDHQPQHEEDEKSSQASLMVSFVTNHCELFYGKNKYVYAQDKQTKETRRLDSRQFKDWLMASFYTSTGKVPRGQSVSEAISTLSGFARFKGEYHEVHIRVAKHNNEYFLDLGEPGQSRAVRITPGHWEIVSDPLVRFLRPETLQPLPEPIRGGTIAPLWQLVNIPKDSRLLVIAYLCECLRPDTPFPVLELIGEQGSAKSTTQNILRQLLDPNACNLRGAPKAVDDIFVSAGVTWMVSYENISHLSSAMQDAFCTLATGGGASKRQLYTDADESVIDVQRPIIINGISASITAQDLVDRTLSIETPMITERTEMTHLLRTFQNEHGRLLGALLDIMAKALARLHTIELPAADRPRLLEFAYFGMAITEVMGYSDKDFMTQFNTRRQESITRTIDGCPVALAMIEWCNTLPDAVKISMKDLYEKLRQQNLHNLHAWPRTARGLGDALRRVAPALRHLGIGCKSLGKIGSNVLWEITPRR